MEAGACAMTVKVHKKIMWDDRWLVSAAWGLLPIGLRLRTLHFASLPFPHGLSSFIANTLIYIVPCRWLDPGSHRHIFIKKKKKQLLALNIGIRVSRSYNSFFILKYLFISDLYAILSRAKKRRCVVPTAAQNWTIGHWKFQRDSFTKLY